MKPVFDEKGLATEAGEICCFYYDPMTMEYMGLSREYINVGVSMPGHSTDIDPGEKVLGKVPVFSNDAWVLIEDHRDEKVYAISDGSVSTVDYIGPIKDGYTSAAPTGKHQKWDGNKWVTDTDAQHAAEIAAAERERQGLLIQAAEVTSDWKTELALGIISDEDRSNLIEWMRYIREAKAVDISTAPYITWPAMPKY